jgi:hypothetical protein
MKDMTLFEKKRYIIKLIREWFPTTPIYFDEYIEDWANGLTQMDWDHNLLYFAFSEYCLLSIETDNIKDLVLHEVAHGLDRTHEQEGHTDRWLKLFYAIGGIKPWGGEWEGWYRSNE